MYDADLATPRVVEGSSKREWKAAVVSVNFVNILDTTGPAVNELEFNRWLMSEFPDAFLITQVLNPEFSAANQLSLGRLSLRNPLRFFRAQLRAYRWLYANASERAIVYYRHSRLCFVGALLSIFRPDIRVVATRVNGVRGSDSKIGEGRVQRAVAATIEWLDWRLRRRLPRTSVWVDCVTEVQALSLSRASGANVHVVPNGVNCEIFRPLDESERRQVRLSLGIPDHATVVGFCGGFPMQRGAMEVVRIAEKSSETFGVVIGDVSMEEVRELSRSNIIFLGRVPYSEVPKYVGIFDVGLAFDAPGRAASIGNSNQKIRQYLAVGAFVITSCPDIPFSHQPWLGDAVESSRTDLLLSALEHYAQHRGRSFDRVAYARANLNTAAIFSARHEQVMGHSA